MSIDFKSPSEEQMKAMQEFANLIEHASDFVIKYEMGNASIQVMNKLQEALAWMHSFILNGAVLKPIPLEGELLPNSDTAPINSIN